MKKALIISIIIVVSVLSSQVFLANPDVFLDSALSVVVSEIKYKLTKTIESGTVGVGFREFDSMTDFEEFILENKDSEVSTIIKVDNRDCSIKLDDLDGNLFYEGTKVEDWEYTFDEDSYYFITIKPSGDEFNVYVELYGLVSYESGPEDPTRSGVTAKCLGGDVSESWVPSYSASKEFGWSWDYREGPCLLMCEWYCGPRISTDTPRNEVIREGTFTCPSDFCEIVSWYTEQDWDTLSNNANEGACRDEKGGVSYYVDDTYIQHGEWDERTDPYGGGQWCRFKEDSQFSGETMSKGAHKLNVRLEIDWYGCNRGHGATFITYKEATKTCPSDDAPNLWIADDKCHLRAEPK